MDETFVPTTLYCNENLNQYKNREYVLGINDKEEVIAAYRKSMAIINIMVYMMVIFSVILILIVIYNSGNLSFNERMKEFATLKVLGMQSGRIRKIIGIQNLWLSLIGVIVGAPFGKMMGNAMMNSNGENFDYNLDIGPLVYIISGIIVVAISISISYLFAKRIQKLDMVDVLKGVE